jgi:hypothetical protein
MSAHMLVTTVQTFAAVFQVTREEWLARCAGRLAEDDVLSVTD